MEGYAKMKGTTGQAEVIRLRQDISCLLRRRVLEAVESVLEEELAHALGTGRYERSEDQVSASKNRWAQVASPGDDSTPRPSLSGASEEA